eukprot:12324734-Heterocapsa_arctica.AAC.1
MLCSFQVAEFCIKPWRMAPLIPDLLDPGSRAQVMVGGRTTRIAQPRLNITFGSSSVGTEFCIEAC